jgi:hypothetical protein
MIDMATGRAAKVPEDIIVHYTIWFRISDFRFRIFFRHGLFSIVSKNIIELNEVDIEYQYNAEICQL